MLNYQRVPLLEITGSMKVLASQKHWKFCCDSKIFSAKAPPHPEVVVRDDDGTAARRKEKVG